MHRLAFSLLVCAVLALPVPSQADSGSIGACDAPMEFTTADESMAQLATSIAAGGPVDVLAIGSATTVGTVNVADKQVTPPQGAAFPWQMVAAMQQAKPKVQFRLTVRGGRGMTAEEMLPLLEEALKKQRYPLVLWQTGTVEAVRGLRPDGLLEVLHDGAERVRDAGGDLVLIDPQFSRFLRANTDLDPYEGAMQQVATMPGVTLFPRFELMRAWANDGRIDLERTAKADRDKALDQLHKCLGQALARFVLGAVDTQKQ